MNIQLPPAQLITTSDDLNTLVDQLHNQPLIALDTESNSLHAYQEQVCLIQLSTRESDYLIDPLSIEDLSPLGALTAHPNIEKIFHAAEYDIMCLKRDFQFRFVNLFDTMHGMRILGEDKVGLAYLLETLFDIKPNKDFQRADWQHRPLTEEQLYYAQMDTHFLPALRDIVYNRLVEIGRLHEAQEIFQEIAHVEPHQSEFDPHGFWHLKGTRRFNNRQWSRLQSLYLWREEQAQKEDLPPFKVLHDQTLVHLARHNPQSKKELKKLSAMRRRKRIDRYGDAILQVLKHAQEHSVPSRPRRHSVDRDLLERHEILKQWRKERANQRGVESDIILPKDALWTIAKHPPSNLQELQALEQLGPWRLSQYGSEIVQLLSDG